MTSSAMPGDELDSPRQLKAAIGLWVDQAWRTSGMAKEVVSERLGHPPSWLASRAGKRPIVVASNEDMAAISRECGYPISDEARRARFQLRVPTRQPRWRSHGPVAFPFPGDTAEDEMGALIDLALKLRGVANIQRDRAILRERFGLETGIARTLQEIGDAHQVTRERIRQIEAKAFVLLHDIAEQTPTPVLDAILSHTQRQVGIPEEVVERDLRERLGSAPLMEAIRFRQAVRPASPAILLDRAGIYDHDHVHVIATEEDSYTRFIEQVSQAARKLHSYAGAVMVGDVRDLLETTLHRPVDVKRLPRMISALPGVRWLGGGKRWFFFCDEALSPVLRRAASIIAIAKQPVDFETIYGGLWRDGRRQRSSAAAQYADVLPPPLMVQEILDQHPAFRRRLATSFDLREPFDLLEELDGDTGVLLAALDAHGGVMAKCDLLQLKTADGSVIGREHVSVLLYMSAFIVRHGPSIWAIRGRDLASKDVLAAEDRADNGPGRRALVRRRPASDASSFTVRVPITDQLRLRRLISLRKTDVPVGADGEYALDDGHRIALREDSHGLRLAQLGVAIIGTICTAEGEIHITFDIATRTAQFFVLPGDGDTQSRPQ